MATFDDAWRRVLLHIPSASVFLAQSWVQDAYNDACTRRNWSHLRAETTLRTKIARTGTAAVVQDSLTVTGAGLVFAASDVGRQFRLASTIPLYTIAAVSLVGATSATLDRAYAGATDATAACKVVDAYVTMPADFKAADVVADPSRWWLLRLWVTEQQVSRWDPIRSVGGPPRVLASRPMGQTTALAGRVQYELWPHSEIEAYWPMLYFRKPETLAATTDLIGPFSSRVDVLVKGALWQAAQWPGPSADRPNPYYDLKLAQRLEAQFASLIDQLAVQDEDVYPTWLQPEQFTQAPLDSAWLQQTDYALQ